jgi:hypothetical protein
LNDLVYCEYDGGDDVQVTFCIVCILLGCFLYTRILIGEGFMTILTDSMENLLFNVDIRTNTALASLLLGTSSSAPLQITCVRFKVLQFALASSLK